MNRFFDWADEHLTDLGDDCFVLPWIRRGDAEMTAGTIRSREAKEVYVDLLRDRGVPSSLWSFKGGEHAHADRRPRI